MMPTLKYYRFNHNNRPELQRNNLPGDADCINAFSNKTVLVIGLGAVAGRAFIELARLGVGTLIGVDFDYYGNDSWLTQPCNADDSGKVKARVLRDLAHAVNPKIDVITIQGFAQDLPLTLTHRTDVIVVAADNLEVLVWAGRIATAFNKPLIQGAVHGPSWLAIIRRYSNATVNSACPACGINAREWTMLSSRFGCDPHTLRPQGAEPTQTSPQICATAAGLLVNEVLKTLLNQCDQHESEQLDYCLQSHRIWRTPLKFNPKCLCPHQNWQVHKIPRRPSNVSLSMLRQQLNLPENNWDEKDLLVRGENPWISFTLCGNCSRHIAVLRFGRPGSTLAQCSCGSTLIASPLGSRSILPASDLRICADVPLSELGLKPGGAIGLFHNEQWQYCIVGKLVIANDNNCGGSAVEQNSKQTLEPGVMQL